MNMTDLSPDLISDIRKIVATGCTYVNEKGDEFIAVPISDIIPTLTGSLNHGRCVEGIRRWKNVSNIDSYDLKDAGFKILRRGDNPNGASVRGNFKPKVGRARVIGKYTTLVSL